MSLETFITEYAKQLDRVIKEDESLPPEEREYYYDSDRVPGVVEKMKVAIAKGSFNKDGKAIRATCKVLGVPYTYAGIAAFVKPIA